MSDIGEIKNDIKDIRADVKEVVQKVDAGFSTMDGRVKNLELEQARQQGRESVMKGSNMDWRKLSGGLILILGTSLSIAYVIIERLVK